jgi:hypothetical protein
VGRASGKSKLSTDGEGVPGSSNLSSDEEMTEECVVNIRGTGNNSDLRFNANATLTGFLADTGGSHTNSVSHQSGYVGSAVENSKLSSDGEEVMFNEIVGNTGGVNNNSDLCPDGDPKLLDKGEGVPGSFSSSSDEEMSEEFIRNIEALVIIPTYLPMLMQHLLDP